MSGFKAKCTKVDFSWALPQISLGELIAFLQIPYSWISEVLLLREGRGRRSPIIAHPLFISFRRLC